MFEGCVELRVMCCFLLNFHSIDYIYLGDMFENRLASFLF